MKGRIMHGVITLALALALAWMAYGDWRWLPMTLFVLYLQALNFSTVRSLLRVCDRQQARFDELEQAITANEEGDR